MMARVGRLAGAIVAESHGEYFLIGNTKEPCDFAASGFEPPIEVDAREHRFMRLSVVGRVEISPPCLTLDAEGESLAQLVAQRFLIERNGSVSERLWRLVSNPDGEDEPAAREIDARWIAEVPSPVWQIVRDAVLRCT